MQESHKQKEEGKLNDTDLQHYSVEAVSMDFMEDTTEFRNAELWMNSTAGVNPLRNNRRKSDYEQCGKKSTQNETLLAHAISYAGGREHKCEQCGKGFSRKRNLLDQMVVHSGDRKFKCEQCGEKFKMKGILVRHMIVYTGERKFQCVHCEKKFARKQALQITL